MGKKLTEEEKAKRAKTRAENKAKKEAALAKKRKEEALERQLKDLREMPLPDAKYFYKEGEEVSPRNAHWDSIVILKSLDGGKILFCSITATQNNYGNPIQTVEVKYLSHLEVIPKGIESKDSFTAKNPKDVHFGNTFLQGLIHRHYSFGVNFEAPYQRDLCWGSEDKERLIESIFNHVEIGKFAFIKIPYAADTPAYEILDGKQRLSTLIDFYEDKFSYKGKFFSELSAKDKNHFLNYNVAYGDGTEDWELKDKYEYFLRLNTAGVPQSEEHLKKVQQELNTLKN